MKNLHVPLPPGVHARLRRLAEQRGRPATEPAREAIGAWLEARRRQRMHREIADYAERHAAGAADLDLDPELEAAGVEHLRDDGDPDARCSTPAAAPRGADP